MNLIAVDPGRVTGVASFRGGELREAGTEKKATIFDKDWGYSLPHVRVLVENPRWYPRDHTDVNDLLDLAVFVGELKRAYEGVGCDVELVWPRTWKGNVDKGIMGQRILGRLTTAEVALLPRRPRARDFDHNMLDAVGLGLWRLGRLR